MSVRTDVINLNVNVNGNKAQNDLNDLRKRAAEVKFEMDGLKKGTQAYIDKKKELAGITAEMGNLKKQIGLTSLTQRELVKELTTLKSLRSSVQPFTEEFKKLSKEIKNVENRLYDVKNGVQGFASFFSKIKDEVKQFGALAVGYLGFQFVTNQFKNIVQGAGKLSDSLADIQRVSGLSAQEVNRLNTSLKAIDTRTSAQGLREIAIIAGKLGIEGADYIESFTEAVDKLVVSLGDELGDADQITTQLGKILNVFEGSITGENISKLGNAIVDLANKGVATGGFIVDFTQRLAGLAGTANLTLDASIGLAAGLEETGQRTESSSTAIINVLGLMGKNVTQFAKAAGVDVNQFAATVQNKPVEALLQLSEGLVKNKKGLNELAPAFKEFGIDGTRVQTVLGVIGTKVDFFRQKITEAGVSLQNTSAINEAFALKNETFGATLDKLSKQVNSFLNSPAVISFVQTLVNGFSSLLNALEKLPEWFGRNAKALGLLTAAFVLSNLARLKSLALFPLEIIGLNTTTIATNATRIAKLALAVVTNLLTGNITKAAQAFRIFSAVLKTNPIGFILGALGTALLLFDLFGRKAKDAAKALEPLTIKQRLLGEVQKSAQESIRGTLATIEQQRRVLEGSTASLDAKKRALQKLIEINPDFVKTLTLSKDGHLQGAEAIDLYIKKLNEKAMAEAVATKKKDIFGKIVDEQQVIDTNQLTPKQQEQFGQSLQVSRAPDGSFITGRAVSKDVQDKALAQSGAKVNIMNLEKELSVLDELQKKYIDINDIKATGTETPFVSLSDEEQKKADKLAKETAEFAKEIEKLRREIELNGMTADEAEIQRIEDKYKELTARAKKYAFDLMKIEGLKDKELQQLFDKRIKKQMEESAVKEYDASLEASQDYFDQLKIQTSKNFADGTIGKLQYEDDLRKIELMEVRNRVLIAQDYSKTVKKAATDVTKFKKDEQKQQTKDELEESERRKEISEQERLAKGKAAILANKPGSDGRIKAQKDFLELQFEMETAYMDQKSEMYKLKELELQEALAEIDKQAQLARLDRAMEYIGFFQSALSSLNQFVSNRENRMLNEEKKRNDDKKKSLKRQLDDKLISQGQYDLKLQKLNDEQERKEKEVARKQAAREKAINLFNAIVSNAAAIIKTMASVPFPLNIPLAIAQGIAGGLQVAAIANTPLPELGKGDWIKKGDKHSDKSGGIPVKIERDEAVMSAAAMTDNRRLTVTGTTAQITSALNSRRGGTNWAGGATVVEMPDWRTQRPANINPNLPQIMEQGGIVRTLPGVEKSNADIETNGLLRELISEQQQTREDMKHWQTKLKAELNIKEFREKEQLYDNAKKASGFDQ